MREIKFRGKNGEWVYGFFVSDTDSNCYIFTEMLSQVTCCSNCGIPDITFYEVDPATVGQYTGLKDKNSVEIYTGDILDYSYTNPMTGDIVKKLYLVESTMGYIKTQRIGGHPYDNFPLFLRENRGVIIGNIYENPELLDVE